MNEPTTKEAAGRRILVEGLVQGVGFRPFVYGLAVRRGLGGWVRNIARGVEIEVEGPEVEVDAFLRELRVRAPSLAHIDDVSVQYRTPVGYCGFRIDDSRDGDGFQPVPPDVATCSDCMRELMDAADRRFHYPFINCTNCGPRFTIIRMMPYDRSNTTMAAFNMCIRCRSEYEDPNDRRFHAQANACPECGPRLTLVNAAGEMIAGDPIATTCDLLAAGRIVALKGIGGFHLACDAFNEIAVARLRELKGREAKPLALMVGALTTAEQICCLSHRERALLSSPARPIVLVRSRIGAGLAPSVAPGLGWVGVMLPYSPLHHLLFQDHRVVALVMTSGNRSEEPIATDNSDALSRLAPIADAFVLHDRPIHVRCDDSVSRVVDGVELPIRRSRGYAPFPVRLPFESQPLLACGADLKNTIGVARGRYAFLSPHIGDLANYDTFESYRQMVRRMEALFRIQPVAVAHDLHPDYFSTRYALSVAPVLPCVAVQHHHAHVAACMAEHQLEGTVIGVAFDGTGFGTDGCIWGGEFLVADYQGFTRAGHLGYVPMPGGDRAIREPFRMALAHVIAAFGRLPFRLPPVCEARREELRAIQLQLERRINAPLTSSVGRLFDAVASLVGVRHRAFYEGQAAMELEALVDSGAAGSYPVILSEGMPVVVDPGPIVRAVVEDLVSGVGVPTIAARFHATIADMVSQVCCRIRASTRLDRVVLSGGVFQNARLLEAVRSSLRKADFRVFQHRLVPPNDGGICLGQLAVANAHLTQNWDRRKDLTPQRSVGGLAGSEIYEE